MNTFFRRNLNIPFFFLETTNRAPVTSMRIPMITLIRMPNKLSEFTQAINIAVPNAIVPVPRANNIHPVILFEMFGPDNYLFQKVKMINDFVIYNNALPVFLQTRFHF